MEEKYLSKDAFLDLTFGSTIEPEEIFSYLLNAAPDNRRIIAIHIEDQLITYAKSINENEAVLGLEIAVNLQLLYNRRNVSIKSRSMKSRIQNITQRASISDFWKSVSYRITASCSEEMKALCQKYSSLLLGAQRNRIISLPDIIRWYGVKGIFTETKCVIMPRSTWISNAEWFLNIFPNLTPASPEKQFYLDAVKKVGSVLLAIAPPWITDKQILSVINSFTITRYYKQYNIEDVIVYDADAIFGFFALFAVLLETLYLALENPLLLAEDGDKERVLRKSPLKPPIIKNINHPIFKAISWTFLERYGTARSKTSSDLEKVRGALVSHGFNTEQQDFIWRWIKREINLVIFSIDD